MALNEFQDHDDYVEVLDTIGDKLQTVFDNSVDQSEGHYIPYQICLRNEAQLETSSRLEIFTDEMGYPAI